MSQTKSDTPILSRGERLEIVRRRKRHTQTEAAAEHGTTTYVYRRWERDLHRAAPLVIVGPLADFELCYVRRRRSGLTLRALGDLMGLSHKWIHRAERGEVRDVTALVLWWEQEATRA